MSLDSREVSDRIVAALRTAGSDRVFGMPGGGNNLDFIGAAEAAGMSFVLGHHETSVAIMASVYGELTGAPGVCVVTRGPGAANAVNGAANATLDRQPLVVVTDVVSQADVGRIAHQRIDQRMMYAPATKWSVTAGGDGPIDDVARHAVTVAMSMPPGAVHLDFDPAATCAPPPALPATATNPVALQQALAMVAVAQRPVVVLGVGARHLSGPVRDLLRNTNAPVLTTYRAKGLVPDAWPNNAGMVSGATMEAPILGAADLIVFIGMDTVELFPGSWPYPAPVVAFAAWPEDSQYAPLACEVVGDLELMIAQLAGIWPATTWEHGAGRAHFDREIARLRAAGPDSPLLQPQQVVDLARAAAPAGSIATIDSGAHMLPATVLWPVDEVNEMVISSGLVTMGFALPAAIAAGYARQGTRVVCFTGDGGLGMCLGEMETLRRSGLPVTVVVVNGSRLSLISIKAKPQGHGGAGAVTFDATEFDTVARGFGIPGFAASTAAEFEVAMKDALAVDGPSLVDARIDPSGYKDIVNAVRGAR